MNRNEDLTPQAADMLRDTFTSPGYEIIRQRLRWLAEEHRESIVSGVQSTFENDGYPAINRDAGRLEGVEGTIKILQELERDAARRNDG